MTPQPAGDPMLDDVHAGIARYYTGKIAKYGTTPLGVDWSCVPTQELRFVQLLKLCDFAAPFSLNDVGCGYGALLAYLGRRHGQTQIDYLGVDLSGAMIRRARRMWHGHAQAGFVQGGVSPRLADYSVASGIFNVRQDQPIALWERFVARTLADMHATSGRGFAINFLSAPAPGRVPRPGVYQTAPEPWVRWCERELGITVDVVEGYGMREFSLLARRIVSTGSVAADPHG